MDLHSLENLFEPEPQPASSKGPVLIVIAATVLAVAIVVAAILLRPTPGPGPEPNPPEPAVVDPYEGTIAFIELRNKYEAASFQAVSDRIREGKIKNASQLWESVRAATKEAREKANEATIGKLDNEKSNGDFKGRESEVADYWAKRAKAHAERSGQ